MKFNITTFVIQIINFVLLSYILYRVLYKPLRNIMEKRRRLVMEDIDRAVRMKEDAVKIKEKYEKLMKEIDGFGKKEMEKAVGQGEEAKAAILERASREAREEKEKAAAVIENERREMMSSLKTDAAEISAELASRLLSSLADASLHRKLVEMMLKGAGGTSALPWPRGQAKARRRSWRPRTPLTNLSPEAWRRC